MTRFQVHQKLQEAGYSWREAYEMTKYVLYDQEPPTSRTKANRGKRIYAILADSGIDPNTIEFEEVRG